MTGDAVDGWIGAVPVLLVSLLVLVAPGGVALRLLGLRWWQSVTLGAPVGLSAMVVGSTALPLVGWPWSPLTLTATIGAFWLLTGALGLVRRRWAGEPTSRLEHRWWAAAGVAAGAVLGAWPVLAVTQRPDAVPQAPDTIFHLGTVMTMAASGDASTFHATAYTAAPGGAGLYPAGFHLVATTVVLLTGCQAVVAANAVALVASVVVWPLGVLACAKELFGARRVVLLTAPAAAVALAPFPTWLLGYGVLWPNLLGQALVAAALALFIGPVLRDRSITGLLLLLATFPGLAASHPNTLFGLFVVAVPAAVAALVVGGKEASTTARRAVLLGAGALGLSIVIASWVSLTRVSTSMRASNPAGPEMSRDEALVDVVFAGARYLEPAWLAGGLVLVGAVAVLRTRAWWLTASWLLVAGLYLAVAATDSPTTRLLTWPWYNNAPRVAALLVLPSVLLIVAALTALADLLERLSRGKLSQAVAAALVAALAVVATVGANVSARSAALEVTFHPRDAHSWVSDDELAALRVLGRKLPEDAVVAANPWRGGQYLFPVSERRLLFPTEKVLPGVPDLELLGARLDEVGSDPQVCRAAQERGVEWALTGGRIATAARRAVVLYRGVDGVDASSGWEPVATEGPFTLHRRVACAAS